MPSSAHRPKQFPQQGQAEQGGNKQQQRGSERQRASQPPRSGDRREPPNSMRSNRTTALGSEGRADNQQKRDAPACAILSGASKEEFKNAPEFKFQSHIICKRRG